MSFDSKTILDVADEFLTACGFVDDSSPNYCGWTQHLTDFQIDIYCKFAPHQNVFTVIIKPKTAKGMIEVDRLHYDELTIDEVKKLFKPYFRGSILGNDIGII